MFTKKSISYALAFADAVLVVQADIEPDGRVEGTALIDHEVLELVGECLRFLRTLFLSK